MIARLFAFAAVLLLAAGAAFGAELTVTDMAGRSVTVPMPARRIVLGEARQLVSLSLIDREVARRVVGVAGTRLFDPELREAYAAAFPEYAAAAKLDDESSSLSPEKTIAAEPDLVILSGDIGSNPKTEALVATLSAAGIPAVFIDFRADPYENTVPSVALLGKVLGRVKEAQEFLDFYRRHRDRIVERAATIADRPKVLLHMQASTREKCCMAPSRANLGRFVAEAGGINIGEAVVPGAFAPLSPEYVLAQDPDVYIGTGGRHMSGVDGIVAGPDVSQEEAEASLRNVTALPVLAETKAVREGRTHGLWHNFHNSPLNVVALEVMATWFHPDAFADVDPKATLAEINARFLPVPLKGALWVDARKE